MTILIAVPCMDSCPIQFAQSLACLNKPDCNVRIYFEANSMVYTSRNKIVLEAIRQNADYVLWLDSDMLFPPDTLNKLLEDILDGKDIVTGVYFRRLPPYTPVIFSECDFREDGKCDFSHYPILPDADIFEVAACGFGCVLTKTKVLSDVLENYGTCFAPIGNSGEDTSFCWRARQLGYKIHADQSIPLGHVGHIVTTRDFYNAYRKSST